jgi:hypothetical protein
MGEPFKQSTNVTEAERKKRGAKSAVIVERLGVKPLKEFHSDPIYGGDLHRPDMAWSKHAAGCGLTLEQIRNELFDSRDLSKKGNRKRQLEYAERTARKAIEQTAR